MRSFLRLASASTKITIACVHVNDVIVSHLLCSGSMWKSEIVPFVKVVIEKVDDRNAERIMRTEILDRFVIKSLPTDVPVIS